MKRLLAMFDVETANPVLTFALFSLAVVGVIAVSFFWPFGFAQ